MSEDLFKLYSSHGVIITDVKIPEMMIRVLVIAEEPYWILIDISKAYHNPIKISFADFLKILTLKYTQIITSKKYTPLWDYDNKKIEFKCKNLPKMSLYCEGKWFKINHSIDAKLISIEKFLLFASNSKGISFD